MKITTLAILAGAVVLTVPSALAAADKKPNGHVLCHATITPAVARQGGKPASAKPLEPRRFKAVDKSIDGCPVLVLADSGKMIAPPVVPKNSGSFTPLQ